MTNKIINGIDVSECPLFDKKTGCHHTFNGECVKDSCTVYKWLLEHKRLQQELDIKEKMLDKFMIGSGETLEKLQQENEGLKKLKKYYKGFVANCRYCDEWYMDKCNYIKKDNKYKQALEKIINIAEKLITETPEYHSCYYKDECGNNCTPKKQSKVEYCCYENVDKILTITNEVLNDRD